MIPPEPPAESGLKLSQIFPNLSEPTEVAKRLGKSGWAFENEKNLSFWKVKTPIVKVDNQILFDGCI
jgi:hypothetical protein